MKKLFVFLIIINLLFLNSCKEDIELVGDFNETAIVYGLLDQSDSIHYIKINRAFIGPGNALEFAQIPDSNYFENLEANITEIINGNIIRTWELSDTLITDKDQNGVFYAPEQKVYYFNHSMNSPLDPNGNYNLEITINKGLTNEFKITGQTGLVNGMVSPQTNPSTSFSFIDNQGVLKASSISLSNIGNAKIVNMSLLINVDEISSNDTNHLEIPMNISDAEVSTSYSASIQGQTFFELIQNNLTEDASIIKRKLTSVDVIVTGGSDDFLTYYSSSKPSTSITQSKPIFTNLSTNSENNVLGIFTGRQTLKGKKLFSAPFQNFSCLDSKSREYLCTGTITGNSLFCSDHQLDVLKSFKCSN